MDYSTEIRLTIPPPLDGVRLDKALALSLPPHSREALKSLVLKGAVAVNGKICERPRRAVCTGDSVTANLTALAESSASAAAQNIPLEIVYEDSAILVVNKLAEMVTHPARGHSSGTLLNAILHHHPASANLPRGGIVHRLDKGTSGLIAVAKTEKSRRALAGQFKDRTVGREYLALAHGRPPPTGWIKKPLGRSRADPLRIAARIGGREAATHFQTERAFCGGAFSLLRCRLATGRTHQIRAHLESIGYPLVGDKIYRKRARPLPLSLSAISRQMLHAETLKLNHPDDRKPRHWTRPPPPDFLNAIRVLENAS